MRELGELTDRGARKYESCSDQLRIGVRVVVVTNERGEEKREKVEVVTVVG